MSDLKDQLYSWLQILLKDKGWQIARSGMKIKDFTDKQKISEESGYWKFPAYTASKPPRWILNFKANASGVNAFLPGDDHSSRIGQGNTAQGNVVGISVRIAPVFQLSDGKYRHVESWEWHLLFLTQRPLSVGSSSETFDYFPSTGKLIYKDAQISYVFASLIALNPPSDSITIDGIDITYQQATGALQHLLHTELIGQMPDLVKVYDLSPGNTGELEDMKQSIQNAIAAPAQYNAEAINSDDQAEEEAEIYSERGGELTETVKEIAENLDLIGIDPVVYRQINAALRSGKQHLMLYGPPGTGKTTLARWIASQLAEKWNLVTGSSDWSSQDIIGGYQPVGAGSVAFIPGILLKTFDQPFIIDELNRCDIDKVLGPLFTVLSGHSTLLPYRTNIEDPQSPAYSILPTPKPSAQAHEFAPGRDWRLIATINSIDKASLYQMSYALSRRKPPTRPVLDKPINCVMGVQAGVC